MRDSNPRHPPCKGDATTAELITRMFLLKFEVQFVIPITHFSEDISVFVETKFLGVLIRTF